MVWMMAVLGLTGCIQVGGQDAGTRLDSGSGPYGDGTWGTMSPAKGQQEPWVLVEHYATATCGVTTSGSLECLPGVQSTALPAGKDFVQVELTGGALGPMGCALRASGEVACFAPEGETRSIVAEAPSMAMTKLAGRDFLLEGQMCGLDVDGHAHCWGDVEEDPPEGEVFVDLDGSDGDFCGLRQDGTVLCWEAFGSHRLEEPPDGVWEQVSVGWRYACVRAEDEVECWGLPPGDTFVPDEKLVTVEAGEWSACGIRDDGSVVCWGEGAWGQNDVPAGAFVDISPAEMTVAGLRDDGWVEIWGGAFGR